MSRWLLVFMVVLIPVRVQVVANAGFQPIHNFKPGDVISADLLNERFELLEKMLRPAATGDFIGSYKCNHWMSSRIGHGSVWVSGLKKDSYGDLGIREDTLVISKNKNGTFSYRTLKYNSFTMFPSGSLNYPSPELPIRIRGNMALLNVANLGSSTVTPYAFERNGPNQITFSYMGSVNNFVHQATCSKIDRPATNPETLRSSNIENRVFLEWNDSGDDESGFKVFRRNSLLGSFHLIAVLDADVTEFEDELTRSGSYWYRVQAYNEAGASAGTNVSVVKVAPFAGESQAPQDPLTSDSLSSGD